MNGYRVGVHYMTGRGGKYGVHWSYQTALTTRSATMLARMELLKAHSGVRTIGVMTEKLP